MMKYCTSTDFSAPSMVRHRATHASTLSDSTRSRAVAGDGICSNAARSDGGRGGRSPLPRRGVAHEATTKIDVTARAVTVVAARTRAFYTTGMPSTDAFLMSPPRPDWRIHGNANVFSQASAGASTVARGAALREWLTLADAVAARAPVLVVPFTDDATLTGMPYTAEAGLLVHHGGRPLFLLPNVKPPHRKGEAAHIARTVTSWGWPTRDTPVLWEGQGDVLEVPTASGAGLVCTSGDGPWARSSEAAYDVVAPLLGRPSMHLRFRGDPWFHGNTFLASFHGARERVVMVCEEALLPGGMDALVRFAGGARVVVITRQESLTYGTNALQIGDTLLAPRGVADVFSSTWRALGLTTVEIELPTLFARGGGAGVCMTNRMRLGDLELAGLPPSARYENVRASLVASLEGS
jgi:N-dimethylarginine dimethylaminohydrolase